MSLNQSFSLSKKTLEHSVDFTINESFSERAFKNGEKIECGVLHIKGHEYKLSYAELCRISDTLNSAKEVVAKKYKLGLLPK